MTLLPALTYEIGAIGFWAFTLGTAGWNKVHQVAWSQDLVMVIVFMSFIMFVYYTYKELIEEEEARVDVPRYERPAHERYVRVQDPDGDRP